MEGGPAAILQRGYGATISEMELSGSTTNYKAFGSWKVEGLNAGTYGIG